MSIEDIIEKIKGLFAHKGNGQGFAGFCLPDLKVIPDDLFFGLIIILVAFGAFGLGRLSKIEGAKTPIRIENAPETTAETFLGTTQSGLPIEQAGIQNIAPTLDTTGKAGQLVASKSGKKYYYPWCMGVQKIAEANRIYFTSKAEAEARGYTPSATCKGL